MTDAVERLFSKGLAPFRLFEGSWEGEPSRCRLSLE